MTFFKPEDFHVDLLNYDTNVSVANIIANIANAKLERESKQIWVFKDKQSGEIHNLTTIDQYKPDLYRHKALMINIEPRNKCEHSLEKIRVVYETDTSHKTYLCECGVKVKPVEFEEIE